MKKMGGIGLDNVYGKLMEMLNLGMGAAIVTILEDVKVEKKNIAHKLLVRMEDIGKREFLDILGEDVCAEIREVLEVGGLRLLEKPDGGKVLIEAFLEEPQLIVLGGGHIAKPLVEFGAKLGYEITVVDDRPMFANQERFPGAKNVICDSFEHTIDKLALNKSSYVVIVTRGHRHDMICLRHALKYETAYIGMIGSKHRVGIVRENLTKEGFDAETIDKIKAPIGLNIGAVTPEEIAVSIIAEIISSRRLREKNVNGVTKLVKNKGTEFDREVIGELSKASEEPRAIVTIVSTKGSVPRHEGAKMIVWAYGRIIGSIGGGCCEAEVITAARELLKDGGTIIKTVDLTNDDAEEEGMVCGGTMEVLIEAYCC